MNMNVQHRNSYLKPMQPWSPVVINLFRLSATDVTSAELMDALRISVQTLIAKARFHLLDDSDTAWLIDVDAPWDVLAKAARADGHIALAQEVEKGIELCGGAGGWSDFAAG